MNWQMWREKGGDEESDAIDEFARGIEDLFSGFYDSLCDVGERSLKPLYRIEASEESLKIAFDLPFVSKREDLDLSATEETLSIEAKTNRPVSVLVGGPYQKKVEFERYCTTIRLPTKVNPESAAARFRNGILVVEFPLAKSSHTVKIQ